MCLFQYDDDPESEERVPDGPLYVVDPTLTAPSATTTAASGPVGGVGAPVLRTTETAARKA
ncbi:hypothetical protein ACFWSF_36065 [Streptomyces sp. NPDC058611]|uniref:hypothetical protein n=1 Tax=unclassified Streptomyces TaxID=2593676 RepID=UPI00365E2ECF